MSTKATVSSTDWLKLGEKKQFSRILYPNPVCFLSTVCTNYAAHVYPPRRDHAYDDDVTTTRTSFHEDVNASESSGKVSSFERNVMVLSWLTATNNEGRFMFSLNRRRHSASMLQQGNDFLLSVPTRGMEELVLQVGRVTGRFGSKFQKDHDSFDSNNGNPTAKESAHPSSESAPDSPTASSLSISRRQKRHNKSPIVAGLEAVVPGAGGATSATVSGDLFAIAGTVAHLKCRAYSISSEPAIDNDHFLVLAEVKEAFVHPSYWNVEKNLFQPLAPSVAPFLTFFGSQTFGYVVAQHCDETVEKPSD